MKVGALETQEYRLLRSQVLEKTSGRCSYCGRGLEGFWHMDHVAPSSRGGPDEIWNLWPACMSCNSRKNNGTLAELRFRRAVAKAERPQFSVMQRAWLVLHGVDIDALIKPYLIPFYFEEANLEFPAQAEE